MNEPEKNVNECNYYCGAGAEGHVAYMIRRNIETLQVSRHKTIFQTKFYIHLLIQDYDSIIKYALISKFRFMPI